MEIFILVPSLSPVGPVKGAIALANALVSKRRVTLAILKSGPGVNTPIDAKIKIIPLYEIESWRKRLSAYKKYLEMAGGKDNVASISSCFSADVFNLFCRNSAIICSSIRGNLPHNYHLDYGWKGNLLAVFHLYLVRGFHHVVTMTKSMSEQVTGYLGRSPEVIGNFIDEAALENFRRTSCNSNEFRFVFVGSLSSRKRPLLLMNAIKEIYSQGYKVNADFIGDGPLRGELETEIIKNGLSKIIQIHGQLDELHHIVASADVFVLPSTSEGVSRACLEALCLGIPAVLRDVDGNPELIKTGVNGYLFNEDSDLAKMMLAAAELSRKSQSAPVSLLPENFRQSFASEAYLNLVENNNG